MSLWKIIRSGSKLHFSPIWHVHAHTWYTCYIFKFWLAGKMDGMSDVIEELGRCPPTVFSDSLICIILHYYLHAVYILSVSAYCLCWVYLGNVVLHWLSVMPYWSYCLHVTVSYYSFHVYGLSVITIRLYWSLTYDYCVVEEELFFLILRR